jgi:hypothetical protein
MLVAQNVIDLRLLWKQFSLNLMIFSKLGSTKVAIANRVFNE